MKYVIGLDGGGTKTKLTAVSETGEVLLEAAGGPSNICSNDRATVEDNMKQLLSPVIYKLGEKAAVLCIGSAGIVAAGAVDFFEQILAPYADKVLVFNDAYITLFAGLREGAGLVLTAGTGSICYGKNQNGTVFRTGGWGHLMGDGGSGYDIGLTSLRYLADCHDARKPMPGYFDAYCRQIGVTDFDELVGAVHERFARKEQIASLAVTVGLYADQGDAGAVFVMQQCTDRLVLLCQLTADGLGLTENFDIKLNGSILLKNKAARAYFDSKIHERFSNCRIAPLEQEAVAGAVYLAMQELS